jgi:hypothetical protein
MALVNADHEHHESAVKWWGAEATDQIIFSRVTQMSVLRLLTTAAVMGGKPLTMAQAWATYSRIFEDERVSFASEPPSVERSFREHSSRGAASPKMWADAYIAAFAQEVGATLITFDRGLARRSDNSLLLS